MLCALIRLAYFAVNDDVVQPVQLAQARGGSQPVVAEGEGVRKPQADAVKVLAREQRVHGKLGELCELALLAGRFRGPQGYDEGDYGERKEQGEKGQGKAPPAL